MTSPWTFAIVSLIIPLCYSLPTHVSSSPELQMEVLVSAYVCPNVRSIWSIILSCLVSLVACSWNAVHPNIPGVDERWWTILFRRLGIMALVAIAPELLLVWVFQQFTSAGMAAKAFNEWRATSDKGNQFEEWSRTHGFFAEMGGFQLYFNGLSHCPLTVQELARFIDRGVVIVPIIREADILDRSKNDGFNKAFVVSQLLWFVFQFITRVVYRLPPTLLEVETLGLVILSFVGWGLWWKKPKDVSRPYRIDWMANADPGQLELRTKTRHDLVQAVFHPMIFGKRLDTISPVSPSAVSARRVPTFHSGSLGQRVKYDKQDRNELLFLAGATMVFGGVHFFSVTYPFPSTYVSHLWFFCIGMIIALPLILTCSAYFRSNDSFLSANPISLLLHILLVGSICFYLLMRILIFALVFWSFHSLPSDVYHIVCWTTPIPHLFS
ncbi:hypothetical protein PAXRUDRAFT_650967 [Paxillus rubicundulus Ve08.2h10]|uniref:Uncharacterized protein n=1 Tax=Paxillus rubicundulus Ve08.2h10 TaxID=930991 RepID=A0A0D0DJ30_9AGAM|nr:hypothetical protein PAXRUDRAFT_650967 [Paxillus rubicundulus Ve08.2h10]